MNTPGQTRHLNIFPNLDAVRFKGGAGGADVRYLLPKSAIGDQFGGFGDLVQTDDAGVKSAGFGFFAGGDAGLDVVTASERRNVCSILTPNEPLCEKSR